MPSPGTDSTRKWGRKRGRCNMRFAFFSDREGFQSITGGAGAMSARASVAPRDRSIAIASATATSATAAPAPSGKTVGHGVAAQLFLGQFFGGRRGQHEMPHGVGVLDHP